MQMNQTRYLLAAAALVAGTLLTGCSRMEKVSAKEDAPAAAVEPVTVGVAPAVHKPISRQITLSAELVPYQEIDIYAKESGYLKQLLVDYGTRVKKGQLVATLEIPELQMQLQQDAAAIKNQQELINQFQHQVERVSAQVNMYELQFKRLKGVADSKPGMVAQQEVDDADAKYLAAQAQLEGAKSSVASAQSELAAAQAKEERDHVLFDYSRIYAPFSGIITQRFANEGTLVQAGTSSATNVLPIARLSQDDLYRLVIPVPESGVKYIRVGDAVDVRVGALDRTFPGKVVRFSGDINQATRTMHTEVDVPNPNHVMVPGMEAEATLTLQRDNNALAVPLQAVNHEADKTTVYVVGADNRIQDRPVTLGLQTANDAQVLSGLKPGDKVVVSDRGSLKPGDSVKTHEVDVLAYQPSGQ